MKESTEKIIHNFFKYGGYVLLAIAVTIIIIGYAGVWYTQGFWAMTELLSPYNIANYFMVVLILSPGLLFLYFAGKFKNNN